jgi:hypothetical protein
MVWGRSRGRRRGSPATHEEGLISLAPAEVQLLGCGVCGRLRAF